MMRIMKTGILFIGISLVTVTGPAYSQVPQPDSLTVTDLVRMAVSNNPALIQAQANVRASNVRVKESQTVDLPMAGIQASYARIGPVPELFFPGLGIFKLYPENNYDAHIGIRQTVYDFGMSSASTDATRSRIAIAEQGVSLVKSSYAYQTIQIFYSILFLQRSIQVENQEIQTLNEHLLVNKKRLETGTGTEFEVLTTQVRVAAAQNQKIDLENSLQKQTIALRRFIGLPEATSPKLKGEFLLTPVDLDSDSLIAVALRQRPEYLEAQAQKQTASFQYQLAEKTSMPAITVNASYGVKNGFIPNLDILRGNWVAGVEVQVPFYEGGITEYKEEEAQATVNGSEAHMADVERQITAEVRQSLSDLRAAQGKLEATSLEVEQAQDALSIAQRQFDAGTVSNLDVLDAETSLSQAHLLRLRALYQYVSSRYALDHAIGTPIWNQEETQ